MERLKELISQLMEQFDRKAEPSQMLQTTQLLEAELRLQATQPAPGRVMPTKIAVMMPSAARITPSPSQPASSAEASAKAAPTAGTPASVNTSPAATASPAVPASVATPASPATAPPAPAPVSAPVAIGVPVVNGVPVAAINGTAVAAPPTRGKEPERGVWPFDPLAEKPIDRFTLSQKSREINDIIGGAGASLNEKLKSDIVDLRSALNDTPVRDLKKAIGVNDRYVFVNQLFRGDEAMYERSIKTINAFRILPEAEYWMERELKVKLGWDENNNITRYFYQLVKRRFS
jgi:hypothetical protein